jgi:hypothetical protein
MHYGTGCKVKPGALRWTYGTDGTYESIGVPGPKSLIAQTPPLFPLCFLLFKFPVSRPVA